MSHFGKCLIDSDEENFIDTNTIHEITWAFVILRIFELSETVFFVLRKKRQQITFLHIYHQVSSVLIFWSFLKYSGGYAEVFLIVISEFAHVIKYSYYLLSSYTNVTRIYLFLKFAKPITIILQILQLSLIFMQSISAVKEDCGLSNLFYVQIVNVIALFFMYGRFFVKNYMKSHGLKY